MLCSNAEGASLKLCNFEDPSGLKANLEGEIVYNYLFYGQNTPLSKKPSKVIVTGKS